MKPITRRFLCVLVALVTLVPHAAFSEAGEDITNKSTTRAKSYLGNLSRVTDGDLSTVWTSSEVGEQYFQVLKPMDGDATLSVLFTTPMPFLLLQQRKNGVFHTLQKWNTPESIPSSFLLTGPESSFRLVTQGEMNIAEMHMATGDTGDHYKGLDASLYQATPAPTKTAKPTPSPRPTPTPKPTLTLGSAGKEVTALQRRLKELNYFAGALSGKFAQHTEEAVRMFQKQHDLEETGLVDEQTRTLLYSKEARKSLNGPATAQDNEDELFIQVDPTPKPGTYIALISPSPAPQATLGPTPKPTKMPRTASALIDYAYDKVGKGYIYGGQGEICTLDFRRYKARQYPEYRDLIMGDPGKEWDGMEVYDCNGLLKSFLAGSEGEFPDSWHTNVNGAVQRWMADMGPIDTMPNLPGLLLLCKNDQGNGYTHIGLYAGNGVSIHARGTCYGVVRDNMPYLWTHWARPSWLTYDVKEGKSLAFKKPFLAEGEMAIVDTSTNADIQLYAGPNKEFANLIRGATVPNRSLITIAGVPTDPDAHYWRLVTIFDEKGREVTGYVYAKELSSIEPIPTREPMVKK